MGFLSVRVVTFTFTGLTNHLTDSGTVNCTSSIEASGTSTQSFHTTGRISLASSLNGCMVMKKAPQRQ